MPNSFKYQWLEAIMSTQAKPMTKNVAWVLFKHASIENQCWPNLTTIDKSLGGQGHGKNIHRQIRQLSELGFIQKTSVKVLKGTSTRYSLCMPKPQSEVSPHQIDSDSPSE
jgi:hypothetical protein